METSVLWSTFLLTMLSIVGLLFFIRASVKERIQVVHLKVEQSEKATLEQISQYFVQRAYQVAAVDDAQQQITFQGMVRPSLFLALFLSGLAAIGVLCLALVLSILFPAVSSLFFGLVLFSPIAGLFYWQRAKRPETILLKVEPSAVAAQSLITVTAHRDELAELRRSLPLAVEGE